MGEEKKRPEFVQDARIAWYFEHKKELERDHAGEWVAIGPDGLVAWGTSLRVMKQEALVKGVTDPLFAPVLDKELQGKKMIRRSSRCP